MRILVVEQDRSIQRVLTIALAGLGYEVEMATDTDEAIFSLNLRWPDVMVTNLELSGSKGESICHKILHLFNELPPTVVFSPMAMDFAQRRSFPKIVFLRAPYTVEELQRSINRAAALQELENLELPQAGYC